MRRTTFTRIAILAVLSVLAIAPSAIAQNSSATTYGGPGGDVESLVDSGANAETGGATADGASGLPFTGLDLSLAVGGGLILLLTGLGLSRLVVGDETS